VQQAGIDGGAAARTAKREGSTHAALCKVGFVDRHEFFPLWQCFAGGGQRQPASMTRRRWRDADRGAGRLRRGTVRLKSAATARTSAEAPRRRDSSSSRSSTVAQGQDGKRTLGRPATCCRWTSRFCFEVARCVLYTSCRDGAGKENCSGESTIGVGAGEPLPDDWTSRSNRKPGDGRRGASGPAGYRREAS